MEWTFMVKKWFCWSLHGWIFFFIFLHMFFLPASHLWSSFSHSLPYLLKLVESVLPMLFTPIHILILLDHIFTLVNPYLQWLSSWSRAGGGLGSCCIRVRNWAVPIGNWCRPGSVAVWSPSNFPQLVSFASVATTPTTEHESKSKLENGTSTI